MSRVTAGPIITDMVEDGDVLTLSFGNGFDQPSVHKSVDINSLMMKTTIPVTVFIDGTEPQPASSRSIELNLIEDLNDLIGSDVINDKEGHDVCNIRSS